MRGLYVIVCWKNHTIYVGFSTNFKNRRRQHWRDLINIQHANHHLQNAWNKYGEVAFEFKILVKMPGATIKELLNAEDACEILLRPTFNMARPGIPPSCIPEIAAKISKSNFGRKHSLETRAKISKAHRGKKLTPEHCDKIGANKRGKRLTLEHKAKIGAAHRGRSKGPMSQVQKEKLSKVLTGRSLSDDHKETMRKVMKGRTITWGDKIGAAQRGKTRKPHTVEVRKKMSKSQRDAWVRRKTQK